MALDPASRTGWAYLTADGRRLFGAWDVVKPTDRHPGQRLGRLRDGLLEFLGAYPAELIAYEDAQRAASNWNTGVFHAELQGIIKLVAWEHRARLVSYYPITVKSFAGCAGKHTRRDKSAMLRACSRLLGIETEDDNIADALFILEMARQGHQPATKPKTRRRREPSPQSTLF